MASGSDTSDIIAQATADMLAARSDVTTAQHLTAAIAVADGGVHTSQRGRKVVNLIDLGCCTPAPDVTALAEGAAAAARGAGEARDNARAERARKRARR